MLGCGLSFIRPRLRRFCVDFNTLGPLRYQFPFRVRGSDQSTQLPEAQPPFFPIELRSAILFFATWPAGRYLSRGLLFKEKQSLGVMDMSQLTRAVFGHATTRLTIPLCTTLTPIAILHGLSIALYLTENFVLWS